MTDYNALVELDLRTEPSNDEIDAIMDHLAPWHGTCGMTPRGFAFGLITLPATSLEQAAAAAIAVVERAFGGIAAIACEVLTTAEFDRRLDWVDLPPLVSVAEAAEILGVSDQRIRQRIADNSIQATKVGDAGYVIVKSTLSSRPTGRPRKRA